MGERTAFTPTHAGTRQKYSGAPRTLVVRKERGDIRAGADLFYQSTSMQSVSFFRSPRWADRLKNCFQPIAGKACRYAPLRQGCFQRFCRACLVARSAQARQKQALDLAACRLSAGECVSR